MTRSPVPDILASSLSERYWHVTHRGRLSLGTVTPFLRMFFSLGQNDFQSKAADQPAEPTINLNQGGRDAINLKPDCSSFGGDVVPSANPFALPWSHANSPMECNITGGPQPEPFVGWTRRKPMAVVCCHGFSEGLHGGFWLEITVSPQFVKRRPTVPPWQDRLCSHLFRHVGIVHRKLDVRLVWSKVGEVVGM